MAPRAKKIATTTTITNKKPVAEETASTVSTSTRSSSTRTSAKRKAAKEEEAEAEAEEEEEEAISLSPSPPPSCKRKSFPEEKEGQQQQDDEKKKSKTTKQKKEDTSMTKKEKEAKRERAPGKGGKVASIFRKAAEKRAQLSEEEAEEEASIAKRASAKYDRNAFNKTTENKEFNLKIVTWNVNGIRAWLGNEEKGGGGGGLDYLWAEEPDIFVCQETKCDSSKIPSKVKTFKNYPHTYWLSGEKQGYSGTGLMTKVKPISVKYGMDQGEEHETQGRVITAEFDKFILVNTYVPNSGQGLVRLPYRMTWEKAMRAHLAQLKKRKPIILTGDLNVAHTEIDLTNPKTNKKSAGFTLEERDCFTQLLDESQCFDSFRHLYPDKTGSYTYYSYMNNARAKNIGWRIDYFVLDERLKDKLVDQIIRPQVLGSDHVPVVLFLKF